MPQVFRPGGSFYADAYNGEKEGESYLQPAKLQAGVSGANAFSIPARKEWGKVGFVDDDAAFYLAKLMKDALPGFPEGRPPLLNERCGAFGELPLHIYAIRGDIAACRALLKAGSEVNVPGENGLTPLHEAVSQGHLDVVRLLIESGGDPTLLCDYGDCAQLAEGHPAMLAVIRSLS